MSRLIADADPTRWVEVTGRGLRGGRNRRALVRTLLASGGVSADTPGSGLLRAIGGVTARLALRSTDGRVLAWAWKDNPDQAAVMAHVQPMTHEVRIMRASMPIEHDDTQPFPSPFLGAGEKLWLDALQGAAHDWVTYTWDTGDELVTVRAVSGDRERFGTIVPHVDALARTIRLTRDIVADQSGEILVLPPA
ncbi:MAG: hypothetical protein QM607_12390 [Microbacterium sp.]